MNKWLTCVKPTRSELTVLSPYGPGLIPHLSTQYLRRFHLLNRKLLISWKVSEYERPEFMDFITQLSENHHCQYKYIHTTGGVAVAEVLVSQLVPNADTLPQTFLDLGCLTAVFKE